MTVKKIKLSALKKPQRNVRMHTEKQLKEFERSITMFGQIRPIVVDENCTILAGNGLYEALLRMGRDTADVLQITDLTEAQKKKLMLADNRIFGLGVDDLEALDEFLADLKDDLDIPGYDEDLLKSMVAEAEEVSSTLQEYGTLTGDDVRSIQSAGERKAEIMARAAESEDEDEDEPEDEDDPQEREPVRKFVVCPHCGEKIWL